MREFVEDFKNVFRKSNNALAQLILINVMVFVVFGLFEVISKWFLQNGELPMMLNSWFELSAILPKVLYKPWTLVTYAFMHAGFFHILFNMLILFWFGQLISNYLGSQKLVNLYILGAIAGGLTFIALYNLIPYYNFELARPMVGASAGVLAVVVGAATLLPNYSFHLFLIGPVRLKYIALVLVVLSAISMVGPNSGGDIAHVGGAIFGLVYVLQLQKGRDLGRPIAWISEKIKEAFSRPSIKVSHRSNRFGNYPANNANSYRDSNMVNQDEIDEILDKISDKGYDALSREEKQKLFNASKK